MIVLDPEVAAGTVNVEPLKVPVASVVVVPPNVTADPPKVTVRVELAAKPLPEMLSVVPATPLLGVSAMADSTVKLALADRLPAVSTTLCEPDGLAGTVNVVPLKVPVALVEVAPPPRATLEPPKVAESGEPAGKLEPLTVT